MLEFSAKNIKQWGIHGPRATYGTALHDLIADNDRVYALSADLGSSSGLQRLMDKEPNRYLNTGIAEQNLIGVAAGLAKEGLIPFASSFAPFISLRCADQVRMNMGYMRLNIKAVALGSGISMSYLGGSHYGAEDLAFMSAIPGLTIFSPADCGELVKCVRAAAEIDGPVYIRMTGEPGLPPVFREEYDFAPGRAMTLREGGDIALIATGSMVAVAIDAADKLAERGVSAQALNVHTIKPLDEDAVAAAIAGRRLAVTLEEHSVIGGLGSAVADIIAREGLGAKLLKIGLPDSHIEAGSYATMRERLGLTADAATDQIGTQYNTVSVCHGE